MKVYILANIDRDWGTGIISVHKSFLTAYNAREVLSDATERAYSIISPMTLRD